MNDRTPEDEVFIVVVNHEEQFSIWPQGRDIPSGWRADGFVGDRDACLAHIEEVWTDMRPLSLRVAMAAHAATGEESR